MQEHTIRFDEIVEPPYCICVIPRLLIDRTKEDVSAGANRKPLIVAELEGRYLPVGNIEVYHAYSELGGGDVPCSTSRARDEADVIRMHFRFSRESTILPGSLLKAMNHAVDSGMSDIPEEYMPLTQIKLSDEAIKNLDDYIIKLSDSHMVIPSFLHVIRPISVLPMQKQAIAMSKVISYAKSGRRTVDPPNRTALRKILDQFNPDKAGMKRAVEGGVPKKADSEATVKKGDDDMGGSPGVVKNVMRIKLGRKQYDINLKNATAREVIECDTHYTLSDDIINGEPVYAWRPDDAAHIGLDIGTAPYRYKMGSGLSEKMIIFSKAPIKKAVVDLVTTVLLGGLSASDAASIKKAVKGPRRRA